VEILFRQCTADGRETGSQVSTSGEETETTNSPGEFAGRCFWFAVVVGLAPPAAGLVSSGANSEAVAGGK
jgi:hypothetical protein